MLTVCTAPVERRSRPLPRSPRPILVSGSSKPGFRSPSRLRQLFCASSGASSQLHGADDFPRISAPGREQRSPRSYSRAIFCAKLRRPFPPQVFHGSQGGPARPPGRRTWSHEPLALAPHSARTPPASSVVLVRAPVGLDRSISASRVMSGWFLAELLRRESRSWKLRNRVRRASRFATPRTALLETGGPRLDDLVDPRAHLGPHVLAPRHWRRCS